MKFVVSALLALLLVQASTASSVSYYGSRITDGLTAKPGQFPYQVSIEMGFPPLLPYSHSCGGSIINEYYVLTAAHCASGIFGKLLRYRVKAGMHYLNKNDENVQTVSIAKKILHEGYPSSIFPKVAQHDIAILKLSTPLTFNDRVKAIVLPVQDSVQSGEVVLSGWGSTSKGYLPKLPTELQYAKIPIVDYDTCKTTIEELKGQLYDTMVCTGPLGGSISACSGDSGGPLVESGSNVQVGIVSWGFLPCGKSGAPSVYTRVSSYVDWIHKNIQYP